MYNPLRTFVDIGFVVHVVFNVHRGKIASRDHLKAGHDTSQSVFSLRSRSCFESGPVLFSCTAALVQLVRVKESMFVSFQLIALVQQCS